MVGVVVSRICRNQKEVTCTSVEVANKVAVLKEV